MYFNLPKSQDRITPHYHEFQTQLTQQHGREQYENNTIAPNKRTSSSSYDSNNTMAINEERISEIIHNLDEHWGSPPILTPNTLAHILNHQWVQQSDAQEEAVINREEIRKVSKAAAAAASVAASKTIQSNNKLTLTLIEEFIRTILSMDTENKFDITTEIQSDPVLQNLIATKEEYTTSSSSSTCEGSSTAASSTKLSNYSSTIGESMMKHLLSILRKHNDTNQDSSNSRV